jgi:hypothetical protein
MAVADIIESVLTGEDNNPIDDYIESQKASYSTLIASETTQTDNHGTGNRVQRTTAQELKEAKNFRFTAGTIFDVYAPQISFNATNNVIQSKSSHTQAFHNQLSSVYNWVRAQNVNVLQTANSYRYATERDYIASANYFHQSSLHHQYADSYRLQIGQASGQKCSKKSKVTDESYGNCSIGAINNYTVSTKEGVISMQAEDGFIAKSEKAVSISGKSGVSVNSSTSANFTAKADLSVSSMGPVSISSLSFLSLNSGAVMYLDAGVIFVGIGAGVKPSVSLDVVPGAVGALTSTLAGSGFSVSNVIGLASAVASGNIQGAVSSLAGALIPGAPAEFLSKVSSFTPQGIASAFTGLLTGGEGLGSFLSTKLGNLFQIDKLTETFPLLESIPGVKNLIGDFIGPEITKFLGFLTDPVNGFSFRDYPDIESISGYNTANVPGSKAMVSNLFTSEISSPVLPLENKQQHQDTPTDTAQQPTEGN